MSPSRLPITPRVHFVVASGFEPKLLEPKSKVLPLHHATIVLVGKTDRLPVRDLFHIVIFRPAFESNDESKSVIRGSVGNDLAGVLNTGFNHFRDLAVPSDNINFHRLVF